MSVAERIQIPGDQENYTNHESKTSELVVGLVMKIRQVFDEDAQSRIIYALSTSLDIHADQSKRSDGQPYVNHPLEVATNILDHMQEKDPDLVIAGLLHDSVEDQPERLVQLGKNEDSDKTFRERALTVISETFGPRVQTIIAALSNPDFDSMLQERGIDKTHDDYPIAKNELYAEHVKEAIQDPDVALVKFFDFSSNALSLDNLPEGERKAKLVQKYAPVVDYFIERFENRDGININPDNLPDIHASLQEAKTKMQEYIV